MECIVALLVEKEWLSFGHRFASRSEQGVPIFAQFLDAVAALLDQFPAAFEFSEAFLAAIAQHHRSAIAAAAGACGTFRGDSEKDRLELDLRRRPPAGRRTEG